MDLTHLYVIFSLTAFTVFIIGLISEERAKQGRQPRATSPLQDLPESGDLHATLPLSQQEARDGTRRAIRLPGGRQTCVVVPAGAYEGQVISLEGLGEPAFPGGPRGRVTLTLTITPTEESVADTNPYTIAVCRSLELFMLLVNKAKSEPSARKVSSTTIESLKNRSRGERERSVMVNSDGKSSPPAPDGS